jgi:Tol biopolymer transport system component
MAAPFDLAELAVKGNVTPLIDGIRTEGTGDHGFFQLSSSGRLFYPPGGRFSTDRRLVIVDASGNLTPFTMEHREFIKPPSVSRDGRKAAVVLPAPKGTWETWLVESDRPGIKRLLAIPNADCVSAVWSPDGKRLAYRRTGRDKDDGIYVQNSDGSGMPEAVLKVDSPDLGLTPWSWTSGSSGILFSRDLGAKSQLRIVNVPRDGKPGTPQDFRSTSSNESGARISPDGTLVAFNSDESGKFEIYVASVGADGKVGTPLGVSSGSDVTTFSQLAWAGDSRRLYYGSGPNKVLSVTIATKPALSATSPILAYDLNKLRVNPNLWDILPDGHLLAIQRGEGEDEVNEFNVVLNWFTELRQRMGKPADSGGRR